MYPLAVFPLCQEVWASDSRNTNNDSTPGKDFNNIKTAKNVVELLAVPRLKPKAFSCIFDGWLTLPVLLKIKFGEELFI